MSDSSSDGKSIVQTFYERSGAGDIKGAFGAMHPEFKAYIPGNLPWGGVHLGAEAFLANVVPKLKRILDPHSVRLQRMYGERDNVFAVVTARLKNSDAEVYIGEDWKIKEGKLYYVRVFYFDPTPVTSHAASGGAA